MNEKLEKALKEAAQLDWETKDGGGGVTDCPECGHRTFAIDGYSDDGVVEIGKCLYCDEEKTEAAAEEEAFSGALSRYMERD